MTQKIRVLAVDDHPLLREGIAAVIDGEDDIELVAEATTGQEAIELFRIHRPDVTLMDLQMPGMNGIDTISAIRSEFSSARFIVLTTYQGDVQALRAVRQAPWDIFSRICCAKSCWIQSERSTPAGGAFHPKSLPDSPITWSMMRLPIGRLRCFGELPWEAPTRS